MCAGVDSITTPTRAYSPGRPWSERGPAPHQWKDKCLHKRAICSRKSISTCRRVSTNQQDGWPAAPLLLSFCSLSARFLLDLYYVVHCATLSAPIFLLSAQLSQLFTFLCCSHVFAYRFLCCRYYCTTIVSRVGCQTALHSALSSVPSLVSTSIDHFHDWFHSSISLLVRQIYFNPKNWKNSTGNTDILINFDLITKNFTWNQQLDNYFT